MNFLEIIGLFTIVIIILTLGYKLYRHIFGYSETSCPCDHDTMARYGVLKCNKCGTKF